MSHYCKTWNLCINVEKSKIVVFRNKGKIKCNEKWCIGNDVLEIVEQFTYLGIIFQYNTKFTKAQKQLSDQGRKAMFAFRKNIRGMILNHETLLSLFDCYVGGIIMLQKFGALIKVTMLKNCTLIFVSKPWV